MRRRATMIAMLCLCACGGATPRAAEPELRAESMPAAPPPTLSVRALARLDRVPSIEVCAPGALAPATTTYDFEDEVLEPLPYGPRASDMPPFRVPRSRVTVRRALVAHRSVLRECYAWARHRRPELQGELRVRMPIDRWGVVGTPSVEAAAGAEDLSVCIVDVLTGMPLGVESTSETIATARLRFEPEPTAARPRRAPARPRRPSHASSSSGCMLVADEAAPAPLGAPEPVLLVRDADPVVASDGRPHVRVVVQEERAAPSPAHVRQAIRANVGSYRRCYADALARDPSIEGRASFEIVITPAGGPAAVAVTSAQVGDAVVLECLRSALEEVSFHPLFTDHTVSAHWRFVLTPLDRALVVPLDSGAPDELAANALALLEEGHGEAALARFETSIEGAPEHPDACAWELGALRAALVAWPWGGARVERAARRLTERLARASARDEACARDASSEVLRAMAASWPLHTDDASELPELVLASYAWLASVPESVPGLDEARAVVAQAREALAALEVE